ncbi:MAG: O-antigen ligase family protein, partial [Anaerolinea sp.]|nr:O-antigen ligase family protein [Anaerolinea sp.]
MLQGSGGVALADQGASGWPSFGYRWWRLLVLFVAAYLTLLGGSPYYLTVFPVRVLHHIAMTALLAGWLIHRIRAGKGLPRTPLDWWLAGTVGIYAVTTIFSRDPRVSFEVLWFPLQFILIFYVLAALIAAGRVRLLLEAQFLMAAVVVIAAGFQLASWWFGLNLVPDTAVGWNAALARGILPLESPLLFLPLGVTTWLAAYTAPLALFAGVKALTEKQRDLRIGLLLLAFMLLIVMLLTGSRGGVISLGAGVALLLLLRITGSDQFRRLRRSQQIVFVLLPALIAAVVGAGVLIWTQARASDGSDILRMGLWRGALTITRDQPLTGVGPGMFGRVYREVRDPQFVDDRLGTAHNVFLNTTAETGIGGALILVGVGITVTRVWWRRWRASSGADRLRLEGAYAALTGLVVQSQFDLFTATPIMLLMIFLTAFICVEPGSALQTRRNRLAQMAAGAALIAVIGFGVLLLHWDRAHALLLESVRTDDREAALALAQRAADLDPGMRLYLLWIAYLQGDRASLQNALALEPTWDIGWMHLAAIEEQAGDLQAALAALDRVRSWSHASPAALHWARLAEEL